MTDTIWLSVSELTQQVQKQQASATSLVEKSLRLIDENASYQAVISVATDRALERAKAIDVAIKRGEPVGRLAGVPFIAKDNFLTFGSETTVASNILKGFHAPYQSTAIERLEAEGAICVAKANMDAFAHGSSTENSDWFITKNPHDPTRVPGGSSGGSAAAVALQLAPFALGTDTGGSIRQPAAFCGVVGYKPTYGLVSRSGVVAMASSMDVIGPITSSVADAGLVLSCMAGVDELDGTTITSDDDIYDTVKPANLKGKRIGIIKEFLPQNLDAAIRQKILDTAESVKAQGALVEEVSIPSLAYALACYYVIVPAEISSNLARYDGQRYGFSQPDAKTSEESYTMTRSEGFGSEVKRRIMIGTYVLSSGYYEAYYKRAQQVRTMMMDEFKKVFQDYDVLIGPTSPTPAFKIGQHITDPLQMYLTDIMTVAANLVGIPAVSIPAGTVQDLPVGLQILAPQRHDRQLLSFARSFEEVLA
ncbi:Asp-tRNA(Asn)/Glu-tRNA(Gln) amidotransferase subunit GatA [soil metagenome]